jgi:uncharacterized protein
MIEHLPDRLDLLATAGAGRMLRGTIALASLERVLPALASQDGELQIVMELGRDPDGTHYLAGTIRGGVQLQCQRCLDAMLLPLDLKFLLALPIVALHDDRGACRELMKEYQPSDGLQRENPFAALAELKQKH